MSYANDSNHPNDGVQHNIMEKVSAISRTLPVRSAAVHYCTDSSRKAALWMAVVAGLEAYMRVRMRVHAGRWITSV